jgi:hypothetical protein
MKNKTNKREQILLPEYLIAYKLTIRWPRNYFFRLLFEALESGLQNLKGNYS